MNRKPSANDFFDPARQHARFAGEQMAGGVTEEEVIAEGGELFARIRYTMDPEATLKSMERFVKDEALAKAFADGEVFNAIEDNRVADVKFYKLADGSGMQFATLSGSLKAMPVLLDRVSGSDLKLDPPEFPKREPIKAEPQMVEIQLEGNAFKAQLIQPPAAPQAPRRQLSREERGIGMPMMGMGNPLAIKDMLRVVWNSPKAAVPSRTVEHMITQSLAAASHLAHPDDEVWPAGLTVETGLGETMEKVASPKALVAAYGAALKGETIAPISRDELGDRFRAFREGKKSATDEAAAPAAPKGPGI